MTRLGRPRLEADQGARTPRVQKIAVMKHAVILAHPNPKSVNAALAFAYADALRSFEHTAIVRDLYGMAFDPCLHADELPWAEDYAPRPDVVAERQAIADADAITFVYPFWFNAAPAILKGYVDRVLGTGFGYASGPGGNAPLLTGRSLLSITTSGAPDHWVARTSALSDLRHAFDDHIADTCGLSVLDHVHFGAITPGIREDVVEHMKTKVRDVALHHFG